MGNREWAAKFVGGALQKAYEGRCSFFPGPSDADLANAVRKKLITSENDDYANDGEIIQLLGDIWFCDGNLAFIAAVREMVE